MILTKLEIVQKKKVFIEEDFVPTEEELKSIDSLIEFKGAKATLDAEYVSDLIICKLRIKGSMILKSTRSFVPVDYDFDEEDDQTFSLINDSEILSEDIVLFPKDEIDFREDLFSLIVTSIPLKIIAPDEPENFSGDNWEVISEDEYYKRKDSEEDPRFAALDNFVFDDEEEKQN